jgi:hypothetical protein
MREEEGDGVIERRSRRLRSSLAMREEEGEGLAERRKGSRAEVGIFSDAGRSSEGVGDWDGTRVRGIVLEEVGEVEGGGGSGGVDMVAVVYRVDKGRCALCRSCEALRIL